MNESSTMSMFFRSMLISRFGWTARPHAGGRIGCAGPLTWMKPCWYHSIGHSRSCRSETAAWGRRSSSWSRSGPGDASRSPCVRSSWSLPDPEFRSAWSKRRFPIENNLVQAVMVQESLVDVIRGSQIEGLRLHQLKMAALISNDVCGIWHWQIYLHIKLLSSFLI